MNKIFEYNLRQNHSFVIIILDIVVFSIDLDDGKQHRDSFIYIYKHNKYDNRLQQCILLVLNTIYRVSFKYSKIIYLNLINRFQKRLNVISKWYHSRYSKNLIKKRNQKFYLISLQPKQISRQRSCVNIPLSVQILLRRYSESIPYLGNLRDKLLSLNF